MVYSADGFTWTPSGGRRTGLPTIGVVQPPEHHSAQPHHQVHDVIVIGAGYAGLIAARDLATQGKTTLLLEARDRLGGRTWNATINGFNYEMGGTWIHWHMPHIYREVSYYGLHNDFIVTQNPGSKEDYFTATTGTRQRNMSHDEEADIAGRVLRIFCNLDGHDLKHSWKYPFGTGQSPDLMAQWDQRSCKDRLDEIRDQLSAEELSVLESQLLQMGGSSLDKIGLLGVLLWWSLGSHTPTGLNDIGLHTRLQSGQSELHRRIFEHAKATENLSYRFQTPIRRIEDGSDVVTVTSRDGQTYKAKSVICTIPLNVLSSVDFSPPLPADKLAAIQHKSVNRCNKVHIDLNGPDYLSWSSLGTPGKGLVSAFGDHLTNANNSHLVCFGPDPDTPLGLSLDNVESIKSAVIHLLPEDKQQEVIINRIVSHDWNNDEFSNGTWCFMEPEATTNHLSALQRPHGSILFASADWSDGWRGWIDGAVQSGTQAAKTVMLQMKVSRNNAPKAQKTANGV
ncbi:Amine oxidase [Beauveria bassiana ARSEF 2860]|uniref:Amine oxidase n=1 Tax=Beauveria bassiana (strain ARSEF 2860) TaxID=655819 RepID=J5JX07_BEAB2|nr:Amine oxidase [Beauveria bassiana ARSEF 2860]EJP66826.1 Amine oxidase [Beauveria bassiana ARSEF 2860]